MGYVTSKRGWRFLSVNKPAEQPPLRLDTLPTWGLLQSPTDFNSVSVTYPGPGSPASLPLVSPTKFGIGPSFATKSSMDAAYPFGTYTFTANNSAPPATQTASLPYTLDACTANIPALSAATFAAPQGMNPTFRLLSTSIPSHPIPLLP